MVPSSRFLLLAAGLAIGPTARGQTTQLPSCLAASKQRGFGLTPSEIRAAMKVDQGLFGPIEGDGTPRADTARHLAMVAQPELEGGDRKRGYRYYCAAFAYGVADRRFYRDAIEISKLMGHREDHVVIYRAAAQRWPDDPWAASGLRRELARTDSVAAGSGP
jgi:hypothetical protein